MASCDPVCAALRSAGHTTFASSEQEEAIRSLVAGRDVFAALPTGSGKTLILQLASVCRGGVAVVVSPLLSLIQNQLIRAKANGFDACSLNSQTRKSAKASIKEVLLTGTTPVQLYVTAEMAKEDSFKELVRELAQVKRLQLVCIDEAHVASSWAEHFRPAYARLYTLRQLAPQTPLLLLTATASASSITQLCTLLGAKPDIHVLRLPPRRPNLFVDVIETETLQHRDANVVAFVCRVLQREKGVVLVYCRSKAQCNALAGRFREFSVDTLLYHSDRSVHQREINQNRWLDESVRVMIATVAFGLGIDKANVRAVVHFDLPSSMDGYAQEIGRAGRDGRKSYCRIYLSKSERRSATAIVETERRAMLSQRFPKPKAMIAERCARMKKGFDEVYDYASTKNKCRHSCIDAYFGFHGTDKCSSRCDVCWQTVR